ncbi:hypothetical protein EMPS_06880 [Entomortierella parvispora]|uniref:HTH CENPB-type domain-containing protein n=1 Tax=Entomortierella parvispora TaxID=205924 RepID=A0A9P3HDU0_9FUNG|nr:hypothetical protein EMPS_06880 [Entomortierella parvispora]
MARRSARRHYALHDEEAAESGIMSAAAKGKRRKHDSPDPESEEESGEDSSDADETPITPRRPTQELLQEIRGDRPLDVVRSTVKAMRSSSYQIVAKHRKDFGTFGVTTPDLSESQLREVIQLGYLVQKISLSDNDPASQSSMAISENHARPSEDDIKCLEGGGIYALERLVGAMIKTDASCLLIRCIEGYCRDPRKDPHAEPLTANPSSVPTNAKTTQYPGRLKMRHLSDGHGNPRLIIGVRSRNYLITAGEHDGRIKIGPSRCGRFPILERSELLISKARQEEGLLTEDVLGLAQVRSHFGHKATYTTRRAGLLGCSALSQMPVTIFTLSLRGVPNASIFYTMWLRSRETGGGIILRMEDLGPQDLVSPSGKILENISQGATKPKTPMPPRRLSQTKGQSQAPQEDLATGYASMTPMDPLRSQHLVIQHEDPPLATSGAVTAPAQELPVQPPRPPASPRHHRSARATIMPGPRSTGRNVILTNAYRKEICRKRHSNPELTLEDLGIWAQEEFNLARKPAMGTLSRILAKQDWYNAMTEPELQAQRKRAVLCLELEDALVVWVHECQARNLHVSYKMIIEKAREMAEYIRSIPGREETETPSFSNGWVSGFTKRHMFIGTALNAPGTVSMASLMEESARLMDILGQNSGEGENEGEGSENAGADSKMDMDVDTVAGSSTNGNASSSNSNNIGSRVLPPGIAPFSSNASLLEQGLANRMLRDNHDMLVDHEMDDQDENTAGERSTDAEHGRSIAHTAGESSSSSVGLAPFTLTSKGVPRKTRGKRMTAKTASTPSSSSSSTSATTAAAAAAVAAVSLTASADSDPSTPTSVQGAMDTVLNPHRIHPAAPASAASGLSADSLSRTADISSTERALSSLSVTRQETDLLQHALLQSGHPSTGSGSSPVAGTPSAAAPVNGTSSTPSTSSTSGAAGAMNQVTGRPIPSTTESLAAVRTVIDSVNMNIPSEVDMFRALFEMERRLQEEVHAQDRQSNLMGWVK